MKAFKSGVSGHIDIFIINNEDEENGQTYNWQQILIHGNPEGLKSLAKLLIKIADTNQDELVELPNEAREHFHLRPGFDISKSSKEVVIGRLDAKGSGDFYERYIPKDNE